MTELTTIETEVKPLTKFESLKQLVEWLEGKPLLQQKVSIGYLYAFAYGEEQWKEMLAEMGTFTKESDDYSLRAVHTIGQIKFHVSVGHEGICEKVLVGTKEVTKEVYPDDVKPEIVTETVDVHTWRCPDEWVDRS